MEPLGPSLRRTRRREHPLVRVAIALAASALLNFLLLTQVDGDFLKILDKKELRPVDLAALSPSQWEANRAVTPARPAAPPPAVPVPPPPPPTKPTGQVVDLGKSTPEDDKAEPPPDAKFLSERNTRVEKETRAKLMGRFERTLPTPTVAVKPGGQAGKAEQFKPGRQGAPGEKGEAAPDRRVAMAQPPQPEPKGDLPGGERPVPQQAPPPAPAPGGGGEGGERLVGKLDPRLATSPETLARIAGGPAIEYLGDLEEGTGTFLNSRQWKYTTYFTGTVRPALYANWKAEEAYLRRDPDGTSFPARKWITLVDVVLDDRGYLKSTRVVRPSGLDFLDRVAVDSLRDGSPFLNPPVGLVENGEIRFRQGFVVDMTGLVDALRSRRR
jgi:hypothetical protein